MHKLDLTALCLFIVGFSSMVAVGTPLADSVDVLTFGHGKYALALLGLLSAGAAQYLRIKGSPTQPAVPNLPLAQPAAAPPQNGSNP